MEITGNLIHILPLQTGQGKNGPWKKQDFVIETQDTYPKKICLSAWGDKVDTSRLSIGQSLKVSFDVESREYNGRWYTDLKAYSVQILGGESGADMPPVNQSFANEQMPDDDLPF
jgi:hypothetical protein